VDASDESLMDIERESSSKSSRIARTSVSIGLFHVMLLLLDDDDGGGLAGKMDVV